jgi:carbonic anhydrase
MDGRVQLPVIHYLKKRFNVDYVDTITDAGPNLILAQQTNKTAVDAILQKIKISVEKHQSTGIAIVGHYDCAGNPAPKQEQLHHINKAIDFIGKHFQQLEIVGLWLDENFEVCEIDDEKEKET